MKKLKLVTIIGTRPEIIKLSETIKKADKFFDHILVHTGQNYAYTLNEIFFEDLGLRKPDYYLDVVGANLGETIGNIISKSYNLLQIIKPDAMLILGDTNSALSAISAKRLKIPIFHMEAGNRCFDENLPEELNRRIVDHISDVNLPYTEHARRYLYAEGIKKEYVYVTGSPMVEVIRNNKERIKNSTICDDLGLTRKEYIILSAHREENLDIAKNFKNLINSINFMAETFKVPIIYSLHPRSKKLIEEQNINFHHLVSKLEPFSFSDFISLQLNSKCVVSDSGTLAEESSFLGFPAVSIRTSTERPEAIDNGNFIIGSIFAESLVQSVHMAITMGAETKSNSKLAYTDCNVSNVVIKIIQSYVDIVNKKIWLK